jgi:hypothetical protein
MRVLLTLLAVVALTPSSALGGQPEAGTGDLLDGVPVEIAAFVQPQTRPSTIALFVLAHRSLGTGLTSLTFRDGGWTVRVRNTYACTHGVPGECRTFATAYLVVTDAAPHRFSSFGLP